MNFKIRGATLTAFALIAAVFALTACGYHVVGQAGILPKEVQTIAIVPWSNVSVHYTLSNYLAASVTREFIARTRYHIVSDPSRADAVFYGSVANMSSGGTEYDNATSQTTGGQVTVHVQLKLLDRSGKILFNRPDLEFHERYQISINPQQYFDESEAAMQRLSNDVAKSVVSAILSSF